MSGSTVKSGHSHWSERTKAGLKKTSAYFAEFGDKTGITGGALMMFTSAGMIAAGATQGSSESATLIGGVAGAMMIAGALKLGGAKDAQDMVRSHVPDGEAVFSTPARPKGATVSDDPMFADPAIQKVMVAIHKDFMADPETKAALLDMMKNSPTARNAMIQAQRNMELRDQLASKVGPEEGAHPAPGDEESPRVTMH